MSCQHLANQHCTDSVELLQGSEEQWSACAVIQNNAAHVQMLEGEVLQLRWQTPTRTTST